MSASMAAPLVGVGDRARAAPSSRAWSSATGHRPGAAEDVGEGERDGRPARPAHAPPRGDDEIGRRPRAANSGVASASAAEGRRAAAIRRRDARRRSRRTTGAMRSSRIRSRSRWRSDGTVDHADDPVDDRVVGLGRAPAARPGRSATSTPDGPSPADGRRRARHAGVVADLDDARPAGRGPRPASAAPAPGRAARRRRRAAPARVQEVGAAVSRGRPVAGGRCRGATRRRSSGRRIAGRDLLGHRPGQDDRRSSGRRRARRRPAPPARRWPARSSAAGGSPAPTRIAVDRPPSRSSGDIASGSVVSALAGSVRQPTASRRPPASRPSARSDAATTAAVRGRRRARP